MQTKESHSGTGKPPRVPAQDWTASELRRQESLARRAAVERLQLTLVVEELRDYLRVRRGVER